MQIDATMEKHSLSQKEALFNTKTELTMLRKQSIEIARSSSIKKSKKIDMTDTESDSMMEESDSGSSDSEK